MTSTLCWRMSFGYIIQSSGNISSAFGDMATALRNRTLY